jgi:hypothetical protein
MRLPLLYLEWLAGALPIAAQNTAPGVVISQIYGGGGNAGATFQNDFIELFNRSDKAVSVSGWSVQYASATGSSWDRTLLSGTLQPGQYYLVQEAQGNGGSTSLPAPDLSGGINLSATSGKLALSATPLHLAALLPQGHRSSTLSGMVPPTPLREVRLRTSLTLLPPSGSRLAARTPTTTALISKAVLPRLAIAARKPSRALRSRPPLHPNSKWYL